jgi:hypothetical protein
MSDYWKQRGIVWSAIWINDTLRYITIPSFQNIVWFMIYSNKYPVIKTPILNNVEDDIIYRQATPPRIPEHKKEPLTILRFLTTKMLG